MSEMGIGARVLRTEDGRFLTGNGRYTDDLNRLGQAHAWIVRSPHPHAEVRAVGTEAALNAPGVVAIFTGADMAADGVGGLPCGWLVKNRDGSDMHEPPHPPLATERVRHVGDQVAVVIAETRDEARTAAELVEVDYGELPAATVTAEAAEDGAAQVWEGAPNNVCYDWEWGDQGRDRCGVRRRGARGRGRSPEQPAGAQRHRAPRRDWRVRGDLRPAHALHHDPRTPTSSVCSWLPSCLAFRNRSCASWRRMSAAASAPRSSTMPRR